MKYLKAIKTLLFGILFAVPLSAYAQGCFDENTEEELLSYMRGMDSTRNRTSEGSMDSLYMYNNDLINFLSYSCERYVVVNDDMNGLMYMGMEISVADDHKVGVYSWEVCNSGAMHYRFGLLCFLGVDGAMHTLKYSGVAPDRVYGVRTKGGQTVYLLFSEDNYSLKNRFKRVMAEKVDFKYNQQCLSPVKFFYNGKNDSTEMLEYTYDIASYSVPPKELPEILLSGNKKKISFPIVNQDGLFENEYLTYNFDGNRFILQPEEKKKTIVAQKAKNK